MAKHSRTLLNQLFKLAIRNDGMIRNPVEGTSPLAKPAIEFSSRLCQTLSCLERLVRHPPVAVRLFAFLSQWLLGRVGRYR